MPTYMKCARNYTLRSLSGHILHFKADEPLAVPDAVVDEALAVNIIPCDGYGPEVSEQAPRVMRSTTMSAELREALLLHAIHELFQEADSKDFDGGGRPKAHSIAERSGIEVSASERSKLWDKYRDLKANNSDLPRPRNFELVADAQRLTLKKDLLSFANDLGVDEKLVKGATLKEIKSVVINAAIKHEGRMQAGIVSELDEA